MQVLNSRNGGTGLYIGRPSRWGNPFTIGRDGTRADVITAYEEYARKEFSSDELLQLAGRDLLCWCAPLACHGDVLKKLVKEAILIHCCGE